MFTRLRCALIENFLYKISVMLMIVLLIMLAVCVYRHITVKPAMVLSSGEKVTKLNDVADLKRRMEYHGCLCCQKDSKNVWWFYRNNKLCKL